MQGLGILQAACGGLRHQGNKLLERSVGKRSLFSFMPLPASDWLAPDGGDYIAYQEFQMSCRSK